MSEIYRTLFCPCGTLRCRLYHWSRALGVLAALALLVAEVLVMTNTVRDPIGAAAPASVAYLMPAVQAAEQLRPADITTAAMVSTVNWTDVTCHAFASWERHPAAARLDRLMISSLHVPWKYLGEDVDYLYRAARAGKDTDVAVQYLYADCNDGAGM